MSDIFSQPVDKDALRLTHAIALSESGKNGVPNYNAVGDAGTSHGAYQWQPGNFEASATAAGLNPADKSPTNQDKVAYYQVMQDKNAGLDPGQIASKWNSGSPNNWQNHSGSKVINGQTISYDTPAYVNRVKQNYQQLLGGESDSPTTQTQTQTPTPQPEDALGVKAFKFIAGGITDPLAELYGGARNLVTGEANPNVVNAVTGENVNALGYDKQGNKLSTAGTVLQGAADVGETALNLASFGEGGAVISGAKLGVNAIKPALGSVLREGLAYGTGYGLTGGIRNINANDTTGQDVLNVTGSTALGAGLGLAGAGVVHGVSQGVNKLIGQGPLQDVFSKIGALEREGKFTEADALRNDPQTMLRSKLAGADINNVDNTISKEVPRVKQFLQDGLGRSTESTAMKKSLKANNFTDADYGNFLQELVPPSKDAESFYAPTIANLNNNMSSLYEEASAPLLDKLQKTGVQLGENIDPNNITNLVTKALDKQGLIASDINGLTNGFRSIIDAEVAKASSEGRRFDITDMYKLVRNANTSFEKLSPTGELGRASGDVLRSLLDKAAATTKDTDARAIIARLRQVDKRYSELKRVEELTKLYASLPGQKPSEIMNKIGGLIGYHTGGPIGYAVGAVMTKKAQNAVLAKRFSSLTGSIGNKAKQNSTDVLIGTTKNVLNKIDTLAVKRDAERAAGKAAVVTKETLAKQTSEHNAQREQAVTALQNTLDRNKRPLLGTGNPQAISNTPINVAPTAVADISRGFTGSKPLQSNLRGMATPEALTAMAGVSATGIAGTAGYNALQKKYGTDTYTREEEPKEEPFMKPVVNEHILSPKEEEAAKSVPASMIGTIKKAMEHTGINLDKVINHMKAENGGKWDPNLVGNADPTDRGVTQLNPIAIGILEGTTGPKVDFFQQNFGHKFDINNVDDQILGYATYMKWLKQYALPEQGIKNPTNNDTMLAYNLGAKGLSEIKNKTADATTTARYARYYSLLKQNDALD